MLDNTSDPDQKLGDAQLAWLAPTCASWQPATPVVVLTHRPLFELYKPWGWWTPDGDKALELLKPFKATVFYGHIHHEHHTAALGAVHHATTSLMIPLLPAGPGRSERSCRGTPRSPIAAWAGGRCQRADRVPLAGLAGKREWQLNHSRREGRACSGGGYSAACMSPASMKPPDCRRHSAA